MPMHLPEPPAGVADSVRSRVREFAGRPHLTSEAMRNATPEQVDVTTPHEVFTIGLDDLAAGGGLDKARPVGWRYLVQAGGKAVASAETSLAPDGTHSPSHITDGPFVSATEDAVSNLRALPRLEAEGFELRLLRIPAIYVMALWLHSPTTDLLVPLAPSPIGKEGQLVPATEFLTDIAVHARTASTPNRPLTPGSSPV